MSNNNGSKNKSIYLAIAWGITYSICLLVLKNMAPGIAAGIILSFIPVVAFALFIYSFIKNVAAMDELQIRVQMEAVVIAFSLSLLMLMTLGLLDLAISLNKEDWGYRHLIPYFAIFYFIGLAVSKRKYG